jgi:hypothetical protein
MDKRHAMMQDDEIMRLLSYNFFKNKAGALPFIRKEIGKNTNTNPT